MAEQSAGQGMREVGISRREFLRSGSLGCAALGVAVPALAAPIGTSATGRARSVILLWMEGGPSPYETFAPPSTRQRTATPCGAIPSNVPGLSLSELMPRMAGWMNRATLYRAVQHSEGSHDGAAHLALTGRMQNSAETHLTLGEVLARRADHAMVRATHAECAPHLATSEPSPAHACSVSLPAMETTRVQRRHALLPHLPNPSHPYSPTAVFLPSPPRDFTAACVAARKQVEAGAPFVQVTLSGWDAHADLAGVYRDLVPQLDRGFSTLLHDLNDRSMLEETLVIWMGEFGRCPRINALGGRDHWPYAGCAVLAGGGSSGQVVGEVDTDGYPTRGAVTPAELLEEIYGRVGNPLSKV